VAKKFTPFSVLSLPEGSHTDPGCTGLRVIVRGTSRSYVMRYGDGKSLTIGTVEAGSRNFISLADAGTFRFRSCRYLDGSGTVTDRRGA
jgi:hypothetical protein